jgi:hypothetical protein
VGLKKSEDFRKRGDKTPGVRTEEMASEWVRVVKNFDVLGSEHQMRCLGKTKYRNGLTKAVGDLQDAVSESDRKTQLLVTRIGVETEAGGSSSLWEAVESAG